MAKAAEVSAGLLMYRRSASGFQFLLVHPGGPFYARKDEGVWTLPKGMVNPGEELLAAAQREFSEETGFSCAADAYWPLGSVVQRAGKHVHAYAFEGDCDPAQLVSNTCQIAWPPRTGKLLTIPEVDRAAFFDEDTARRKILPAQLPFLERASRLLRER